MRVKLVASTVGKASPFLFTTCYVINDTVALDAGSLGFIDPISEQRQVRHLLLSHSHADHIMSLPLFLENVYQPGKTPVCVHAGQHTLDCLRQDIFNDRVWPDFIALSESMPPFLSLSTLKSERPVHVEGLTITPIAVDHTVPTLSFLVDDGTNAVMFIADTGPTQRVWEVANQTPNLRAVFLEVSFPDEQAELARVSMHLTPSTFKQELAKLQKPVPVITVHMKPFVHHQLVEEISALGLPQVQLGQPNRVYDFAASDTV